MFYKILKLEPQPKGYTRLSLQTPDGTITQNVSIWPDCPEYPTLALDKSIDGMIIEKGNFKNFKSAAVASTPKTNSIAKAQEKKAEGIEKAQERREEGVKIAATFRDATLLTVAWFSRTDTPFLGDEDMKKKWKEFRNWLDSEFDNRTPF